MISAHPVLVKHFLRQLKQQQQEKDHAFRREGIKQSLFYFCVLKSRMAEVDSVSTPVFMKLAEWHHQHPTPQPKPGHLMLASCQFPIMPRLPVFVLRKQLHNSSHSLTLFISAKAEVPRCRLLTAARSIGADKHSNIPDQDILIYLI